MSPWFPNLMFLKRNTFVLIVVFIVTVITMIRLSMLTSILTPPRIITFMVCLMALLVEIILLAMFPLHQLAHLPLLSHLLVCGWLRGTNSSAGLCLWWNKWFIDSG